MRVKELPDLLRPREKAARQGIQTLSDRELLAVLLRCGMAGKSALDIADELLVFCGGLENMSQHAPQDFTAINGISQAKAMTLAACFELGRRSLLARIREMNVIDHIDDLIDWLKQELGHEKQEQFLVLFLDVRNRLIAYKTLFKGSLSSSPVYPRDVFREALAHNCARIIAVHNHPSGICTPSLADQQVTDELIKAGKMIGIDVVDHLIIAQNDFFSFYMAGLMDEADDFS